MYFLQYYFRSMMSDRWSLAASHSNIDYIYISLELSIDYIDADIKILNPQWANHAFLECVFKFDLSISSGPGLRHGNLA